MESIKDLGHQSENFQFDDRYFYCPNCGKKVIGQRRRLVKTVHKKQYESLSETQKEYVDKDLRYRSFICEHCNRTDNRNAFILGLLLVLMLVVYAINDIAGVCFGIIIIVLKITVLKSRTNFDFERAWECGALESSSEKGDKYGNSSLIVSIGTIIWIIATITFSILLIKYTSEEIATVGDWIFVVFGICCISLLIFFIIIAPALLCIDDLFQALLKRWQEEKKH